MTPMLPSLVSPEAVVMTASGDTSDGRLASWQLSSFKGHDDVIKWKHFSRYWPFVRGIHRSPVNSPHKVQWGRALMFSLIYARIDGWVNNREAGDLRRHPAHYDVIVMNCVMNTSRDFYAIVPYNIRPWYKFREVSKDLFIITALWATFYEHATPTLHKMRFSVSINRYWWCANKGVDLIFILRVVYMMRKFSTTSTVTEVHGASFIALTLHSQWVINYHPHNYQRSTNNDRRYPGLPDSWNL